MKTTHTPGEWIVAADYGAVLQKASKRIICTIERFPYPGQRAHTLRAGADFRLIAAAPDLLEALERILACYSVSHTPKTRENCWNQVKYAIAQATTGSEA